jgi:hypothetical protein
MFWKPMLRNTLIALLFTSACSFAYLEPAHGQQGGGMGGDQSEMEEIEKRIRNVKSNIEIERKRGNDKRVDSLILEYREEISALNELRYKSKSEENKFRKNGEGSTTDNIDAGGGDQRAPEITIDEGGFIHTYYEDGEKSSYKISTDGGESWGGSGEIEEVSLPDMTSGGDRVYASFTESDLASDDLLVSTHESSGLQLHEVQPSGVGDVVRSRIETDVEDFGTGNEFVYMAWIASELGNDALRFSYSGNRGESFIEGYELVDDARNFLDISYGHDYIYITYQRDSDGKVMVIKNNFFGNEDSWSDPVQVPLQYEGSDLESPTGPSVAAGEDGDVVVTYHATDDLQTADIYKVYSSDYGYNWSGPVKVSDGSYGNRYPRLYYDKEYNSYYLSYSEKLNNDPFDDPRGYVRVKSGSSPSGSWGEVRSTVGEASVEDYHPVHTSSEGNDVLAWVRHSEYGNGYDIMFEGNTEQPDPGITLTNPSGGETWEIGTTHTIEWSSQDLQGSPVDIELRQDGSTVTTLASGIDGSQGSYEWTISEDRSRTGRRAPDTRFSSRPPRPVPPARAGRSS